MQILHHHAVAAVPVLEVLVLAVLVLAVRVVRVVRVLVVLPLLGKAVAEAEEAEGMPRLHQVMWHPLLQEILQLLQFLPVLVAMEEVQRKFKQTNGNWLTKRALL